MRATLTIDEDIAEKLKALSSRDQKSLEEVVNEVLRRGLTAQEPRGRRAKAFRVATFRSAFRPGVDPSRLNELTDELEVEEAGSRIRIRGGGA